MVLNKNWTMHRVGDAEVIPAVVPGSVYTDLLREGKMEDPFWKDNEYKALKLMDDDYEYVCNFAGKHFGLAATRPCHYQRWPCKAHHSLLLSRIQPI